MKISIFLIFISNAVFAGDMSSLNCRVILSQISQNENPASGAFLRLFEKVFIDKNALDPRGLNVLLLKEGPFNPMDAVVNKFKDEEVFAYRSAFDKTITKIGIASTPWRSIKQKIAELAKYKEARIQMQRESREETRVTFNPSIVYSAPSQFRGASSGKFSLGYDHGKPVILGLLETSFAKGDEFLIYPKENKTVLLKGKTVQGHRSNHPYYLHFEGRDYFFRPGPETTIYNIDRTDKREFPNSKPRELEGYRLVENFLFTSLENIWSVQRYKSALKGYRFALANLTDAHYKTKILWDMDSFSYDEFGVHEVDGRPIISLVHPDQDRVFSYDVESQEAFPTIVATPRSLSKDRESLFERDGEIWAIYSVKDGYVVANISKGVEVKKIEVNFSGIEFDRGPIRVTRVGNKWVAYGALDDGMVIIDLENYNYDVVDTHSGVRGLTEFTFRGEKYLIWGTEKGFVGIYGLDYGILMVSKKVLPDGISQVLPFEMDGEMYAFLGRWVEPPSIIRLRGTLEEGLR